MHLSKLIITVGSIAGMVATFLPWKRENLLNEIVPTAGKDTPVILSSIQLGDGWLTLLLFALILIIALTGNRNVYLKGAKGLSVVVLSALTAIVCSYDISKLTQSPIHPELEQMAVVSTASYALYLALTCSILIFFAAIFSRRFRPVPVFN